MKMKPKNMDVRTYQIFSKIILPNVFKQGGQDRKQAKGSVVDDLRDSSGLFFAVSELTKLQVLLRLLQSFRCTVKVGLKCCLD